MEKKAFILSASGLKNIVLTTNDLENESLDDEDIFRFIFGENEIKMNRIMADFISPRVSRMHSIDPTTNYIDFTPIIQKIPNSKEIFTSDMINIFAKMSTGDSVDIDAEMSHKIRILSILLENQEIIDKMNEIYPIKNDETNIESIIKYFQFYDSYKNLDSAYMSLNSKSMADVIASKFYSLDKELLLKLSKSVLYSIISSDELKLTSEDSLLDFIDQIFSIDENNKDSDEFNKTAFYELVDFSELSEDRFREFINSLNPNELSSPLWQKLTLMMTFNKSHQKPKSSEKKHPNRYVKQ